LNADHDLLNMLAEHSNSTDIAPVRGDAGVATLCSDVACILMECHRDRNLQSLFAADVDGSAITLFAGVVARRLKPLISGRYMPKVDDRAARDLAVQGAFTGRNHKDVCAQFGISRRLLYSILARRRRVLP